MKKIRATDSVVDFLFIIVAAVCMGMFLFKCVDGSFFVYLNTKLFGLAFALAVMVNILKCLRLYIIVCGKKVYKREFLRKYVITSWINSFVPYKLGEIYRGYSFGKLIGTTSEGYVIVLFDRFIDTIALVSVVVFMNIFIKSKLSWIYIALGFFLFFIIFLYTMFCPMYSYWKKFLIYQKTSVNTLTFLEILDKTKKGYDMVSNIIKGRFWLLYFLSIIAWVFEFSFVVIVSKVLVGEHIAKYLQDIVVGNVSISGMIYSLASFCLYIIILLFIHMIWRENNESIDCI